MSYQFGIAVSLDPLLSIYSLLSVIAFLIFFDYFACMIEYFLDKTSIYKQMIQSVYREIMLMGLVSFAIMVYKAGISNNDPGDDSTTGQVFSSLDFAQMLLFWVTLFQVAHSFYFMILTVWNEERYHLYNTEDTLELTSAIEMNLKYKNWKFLFESSYWPFSTLKHRVEFYLLKDIFQQIYLLSSNFDYGNYLSSSFGKYCVNLVNRSLIAWFFIIFVLLVNFIRITAGFDCGADDDDNKMKDPWFGTKINCSNYAVRLFIFSGVIMSIYFLSLLLISHLYKQRLINLGCEHEPADYVDYLKIRRKEHLKKQQETTEDQYQHEKYQNRELRLEIEQEIHSSEHGGEEDAEIIAIATVFIFIHRLFKEGFTRGVDWVKDVRASFSQSPQPVKRQNLSPAMRSASVITANSTAVGENTSERGLRRMSFSQLVKQPLIGVSKNPSFLTLADNNVDVLSRMNMVSVKHKLSVQYVQEARKKSSNVDFGLPVVPESPTKFSAVSSNQSPNKFPAEIESPDSQIRAVEPAIATTSPKTLSKKFSSTNAMKANQIAPSDGSSKRVPGKPLKAQSFLLYNVVKTTPKHYRKTQTIGVINKYKQPKEIKTLKRIASAIDKDLNSIFFFHRPILFLRAAEVSVIFNSVYMAVWATGMLSIINDAEFSPGWFAVCQILMILPFLWGFYSIRIIVETSSLIMAISDLDLPVIRDVLEHMEVKETLVSQVRQTFLDIIDARVNQQLSPEEFVENLFTQMDTDGNGYLDREELRNMLRKVRVTFSNFRYKLLFRALDVRSRGSVSKEDFKRFIFEDPIHPHHHQGSASYSASNVTPMRVQVNFSPFRAPASNPTIATPNLVAAVKAASFKEDINRVIELDDQSNNDEKNSYDEVDDSRFPLVTRHLGAMSTSSTNSSIPPPGKVLSGIAAKSALFQQDVSSAGDDLERETLLTEDQQIPEFPENMHLESLE